MPFQDSGEIRYFQFDLFRDLTHAVFTRRGGLSPDPWASLNLGGSVGDDPERVHENRKLALAALGLSLDSVFDVWQIHGVGIAIAEPPRQPEKQYQCDIVLTDKPGVTLMMRFADCVPILLHDPICRVIGIVHAGRMGTVLGAVRLAVKKMQSYYGSTPANIRAGIGPSIGPDHYEIGPDVVAQVRQAFAQASSLLKVRGGRTYFDLWSANRLHLECVGVTQIDMAGLCTACHTEDWFSHRAEKGHTGRFGLVVALK